MSALTQYLRLHGLQIHVGIELYTLSTQTHKRSQSTGQLNACTSV